MNNIIGSKLFASNASKIYGFVVDATVPMAEEIPIPNPLAFEGYSSLVYIKNIEKYIEMQNLAIQIKTNSQICAEQKSQLSGFFKNMIINVIAPLIANEANPDIFLGIFETKKNVIAYVIN